MINVGIIGYGFSAQTFHLPFIINSPQFKLVAMSTRQSDDVNLAFPDVQTFSTANELIEKAVVDLVIITAPNEVHFTLAKQCLLKKLHVIIEKPMTTSVAQGIELLAIAKEKNVILSVYHNRRWDGDFLTVKKLLNNKTLGHVRLFESHFDRFRPVVRDRWREKPGAGTGVLFDLGSHLIDQALCLFGLPTALTARCLSLREHSKTVDYFHVQLHYSGLEVILHSSPFMAGINKRFTIEGDQGSFSKTALDPQEEQLKLGLSPLDKNFGIEDKNLFGKLLLDDGHQKIEKIIPTETGKYHHYFKQIALAITQQQPCPVLAEQALFVIYLIELAQQSSDEGKTITIERPIIT